MSKSTAVRSRAERALRVGAVVLLAVVPLMVRVGCEARAELAEAEVARVAGDEDGEVMHLGRALRWRLPGGPWDERALARLLEIAETAEPIDSARALAAYREIRSGLLGSRALDVPHADTLRDVDSRIAAIMGDGDPGAEAARLTELRQEPEASRLGKAIAALLWVAWVVASARLLLRGIDARGKLVPGVGTRAGLLALGLLVAWMLAWRFA